MSTTEAPSAPDLSSLDKRQRLNVAVALTQGHGWLIAEGDDPQAFWKLDQEDGSPWGLVNEKGEMAAWMYENGSDFLRIPYSTAPLPDYAGDPAAWGALMDRQRVWATPAENDGGWTGHYRTALGVHSGPEFSSLGLAVCAAVLAKAGVDPTPYI
jgi:hypothetical protein